MLSVQFSDYDSWVDVLTEDGDLMLFSTMEKAEKYCQEQTTDFTNYRVCV